MPTTLYVGSPSDVKQSITTERSVEKWLQELDLAWCERRTRQLVVGAPHTKPSLGQRDTQLVEPLPVLRRDAVSYTHLTLPTKA